MLNMQLDWPLLSKFYSSLKNFCKVLTAQSRWLSWPSLPSVDGWTITRNELLVLTIYYYLTVTTRHAMLCLTRMRSLQAGLGYPGGFTAQHAMSWFREPRAQAQGSGIVRSSSR